MNYRTFMDKLCRAGISHSEAQAMARMVAEKLLHVSFAEMLCADVLDIPTNFIDGIQQGCPIQYLLGVEDFCDREFLVGEGVLIPRPETEELCQWVVEDAQSHGREETILDIGTGSGAIAITLAKELPEAKVWATDVSEKALEYARRNAERLGAKVDFRREDILNPQTSAVHHPLSCIVSNPPYILNKEKASMADRVLKHEPWGALFVPDADPLLFYRAIADYAQANLTPSGRLFFEINPLCVREMQEMLTAKGFKTIDTRRDQFGKERMIRASL